MDRCSLVIGHLLTSGRASPFKKGRQKQWEISLKAMGCSFGSLQGPFLSAKGRVGPTKFRKRLNVALLSAVVSLFGIGEKTRAPGDWRLFWLQKKFFYAKYSPSRSKFGANFGANLVFCGPTLIHLWFKNNSSSL